MLFQTGQGKCDTGHLPRKICLAQFVFDRARQIHSPFPEINRHALGFRRAVRCR